MSKETNVKPLDAKDVAKKINTIVALLESIDASRETINAECKYLKDTYGLSTTLVRAAANAIKKDNMNEVDEKTRQIQELVDLCDS